MKLKKIGLSIATSLLVLVGAVTFLPLRAIAGLESPCNYISDLVSTNPLSSDLASTGDDHMRCIKLALKTTFPNVNGAVSATDENLSLLNGLTGTVWTSTNDGSGSGLDADLLDGSSSAAFAQLSASNTFTGATQELENGTPVFLIDETDAAANERQWRIRSVGGVLAFSAFDDAGSSGNNAITIDRTGTTVDTITTTAPLRGPNGSASAPAYAFSGATNTGMYNSANVITFSSAGTKAVEFDTTAMDIAGSAIALDDDGTRVLIYTGSGSPEGVLGANVGSLYLRNDSSTTLYVKQTGSGNTGWVAK